MAEFIVRRLLAAVPVLFLVSLIAASIMQLVPGDPAVMIAGQSASDAEIARVREIETLNDKIKEQQGQLTALREQLSQVSREKDDEIASLQQQLSDAENAAREAQDALEGRVAAITADRNEKDTELRDTRAQLEDLQRELETQKQAATTRFTALSDKLRFTKEPTKPDGSILAVSKELGLGWIDLGTVNRLNRGMAFRVVSGDPKSERDKGWARVTDKIDQTRAEVRFFDTVDRFDPIVPGDKIYNPIFDPVGQRNAVLVGRFTGEYNEKELGILLDLFQRGVAQLHRVGGAHPLQVGQGARDLDAVGMTQRALGVAADPRPGGHHHPIADGPDDAEVEDPQPPARQRGVQLLDAIPLVAGGLDAGVIVTFTVRHGRSRRFRAADGRGAGTRRPPGPW